MAYFEPRTWVDGEIVKAHQFNQNIAHQTDTDPQANAGLGNDSPVYAAQPETSWRRTFEALARPYVLNSNNNGVYWGMVDSEENWKSVAGGSDSSTEDIFGDGTYVFLNDDEDFYLPRIEVSGVRCVFAYAQMGETQSSVEQTMAIAPALYDETITTRIINGRGFWQNDGGTSTQSSIGAGAVWDTDPSTSYVVQSVFYTAGTDAVTVYKPKLFVWGF